MPDLWFRGFTKSLCLAAELSKTAMNSGGVSKSAGGERLSSETGTAIILTLDFLGSNWLSAEQALQGLDVT